MDSDAQTPHNLAGGTLGIIRNWEEEYQWLNKITS